MDSTLSSFFHMADTMETTRNSLLDNSSPFLSSPDDGDKKMKKVYTSDYLRQFNKEAPSQLYPFHIGSNSLSHHSYITPSSSSFNNNNDLNIDAKDRQICDQSNLIQKLKSIIYNSADDLLINQMNIAFSESTYYKLTAPPEIPSLSFHGLGESAFPPVIGGQFGRAGSPRKETSQPPLTPASITSNIPQQQQQPTQHKSPRKLNSSSSSNNITNGIGGISGSLPPLTSVASSSSNSAALNNLANSFGSLTGGGSKIKKSPSMPTITKNNNNNNNNNSINSLSNNQPSHSFDRTNKPPLTKSSSNTNISGLHKGDVSPPKGKSNSNNNLVDQQQMPRKQMTKSVSMGAIVNQQDLPIKCTSLEEITGQIYHLTKYQAGCRFLQKKLEENPDSEHVTLIFNEVFEHIQSCLLDPYGQYLIPQLMKYCSSAQRRMIVDRIAPMVETFACHIYGIHGIQKVLQYLEPEQVDCIIASIRDKVITLSKDNKGNYLIQSFLKLFSPEQNQFIVDAIMGNVVDICTHKVGCTVVNRCIDHSNEKQLEQLINKITSCSLQLVQDQFGNYVVQHLLSNNKHYSSKLIKSLVGNIADLSVQKFSSNVIEKCLQVADAETYDIIIGELTNADILTLLQDKYANFVIQTALDVSDENQHAKLVKIIVPYIHQIKTPYVIHIQKKILQV